MAMDLQQWDMDIMKILSAVSYGFQQIVTEVAIKAFALGGPFDK
jgi:hypothetical protein